MLSTVLTPGLVAGLPLSLAEAVPDPDTVTPGVIGFVATAFVAIATILLLLDMNRRVRRAKILAEVRADIAAEQAAAAADPASASPVAPGVGADADADTPPVQGAPASDGAPTTERPSSERPTTDRPTI